MKFVKNRYIRLFLVFLIILPLYLNGNDFSIDNELSTILGKENKSELVKMRGEFESKKNLTSIEKLKYILVLDNLTNYIDGYSDEVNKALDLIEKLKEKKDKNIEAYLMVLEGFTLALIGRESSNPIKKVNSVQKALIPLDKSKEYYSKSTFIPLLCGNVFIALPEFFNQREKAFQTFLFLEKRVDDMSKGVKCNIYANLAELYKQKREIKKTIKYWKKSVEVDKGSACSNRCKKFLQIFMD